ncbi:MAG: PIN domain-containing protein [Spirochaetales bacterium]|nr:PIN domain-containing protein [Spirochaetales bacterium]
MTLIDTNVILRYLLDDIPEQADKAESVIKQGSFTLPEIIAEVVYVLTKLYKVPRNEIKSIVAPFLDEIEIQNKEVIVNALSIFSETAFDFVDCIIISRKKLLNEAVFTFDKKLSSKLK